MSKDQSDNFIEDYKQVINDTLKVLYMRGNEDGKRFKSNNYIGMELENLKTNIINLLADCENNTDKFIDSVERIFVEQS